MAWPHLEYSKRQVNHAGDVLIEDQPTADDLKNATQILINWRACHGYPINTFQATLRSRLKQIDDRAIVAQRLKRMPSIVAKLKRFHGMQLARMQDIGGLRAVVGSLAQVRTLERIYRERAFHHELVGSKDYIKEPKPDGYRSIHLVFRYHNPRASTYDGLHLELQLRTKQQHAWATAVETMGTFLGQALKSNQGERQWLKFFEVAGTAFAHLERSPPVPGYERLSKDASFRALAKAESELHVLEKLRGFAIAADAITSNRGRGSYHLIVLDSKMKTVQVRPFSVSDLEGATVAYAEVEQRSKEGEQIEAVLVSAGPVESLRRAYPNYFLDTQDFIRRVERIVRQPTSRR